jgi:predicted NBD/HSP70 family sugar kinase
MATLGLDIGGSSAKAVLLEGRTVRWEATSARYTRPDRGTLLNALRTLLRNAPGTIDRVGLCVPGLMNADQSAVERSVNVPGLVGTPLVELVSSVLAAPTPRLVRTSDAHAAAYDALVSETPRPAGRFLALSLGTGVGACVLDDGTPLHVSGASPGHVGQLDVSLSPDAPVGPDGGRGSLEAYIGLPALLRDEGPDPERTLASLTVADPPLRALARALRICHAIYRPQHIRLLGGVGVRLAHAVPALYRSIADHLTSVARPGWTLAAGTTDYHAARGAARLADAAP